MDHANINNDTTLLKFNYWSRISLNVLLHRKSTLIGAKNYSLYIAKVAFGSEGVGVWGHKNQTPSSPMQLPFSFFFKLRKLIAGQHSPPVCVQCITFCVCRKESVINIVSEGNKKTTIPHNHITQCKQF